MQKLTLQGKRITGYFIIASLLKVKFIYIGVSKVKWNPGSQIRGKERKREGSQMLDYISGRRVSEGCFWNLFSYIEGEVPLSIACHSWRVLGDDSFVLSFLMKARGGNYHWRAKCDLVTDLITKLRKAVTRKGPNLPTPRETQHFCRSYFYPRRQVLNENTDMKKTMNTFFQKCNSNEFF
jgi:hypothetical protein